MSTQPQTRHWQAHTDANQVLWLTLDKADASVNTFCPDVLNELKAWTAYIQQTASLKAVVVQSGKTAGFIMGADIAHFDASDQDAVNAFITLGAEVFAAWAKLAVPTLAAINGLCLGGGLEFALCCRYRLALDAPETKLGLPEVLLGIHPGWGGTVRLPALIGSLKAFDWILSGRMVSAKQAYQSGCVDAAVPERVWQVTIQHWLNTLPTQTTARWVRWSNHDFVRPFLAGMFRRQLRKKISPQQYPAPFAAVDTWLSYGTGKGALDAEQRSIRRLAAGPTAHALWHVYQWRQQLKALAKTTQSPLKHVHVIGAGVMGADIAIWCAYQGFQVTLHDKSQTALGQAVRKAHVLAKKKLKKSHLITAMLDRLTLDVTGQGVSQADVIIEAVDENLTLKQSILADIEKKARPEALMATNTSTLMLESLNQALQNPARLMGIHFFNPVARMPLVEVISTREQATDLVDKACHFVGKLDKLPLPVKSSPGFLVNRILLPYMLEALFLLEEGVPAPVIDEAAKRFGLPMGPIALADQVGLDICLAALTALAKHDSTLRIPNKLLEMVHQGALGVKSGHGFYAYKKGKAINNQCVQVSIDDKIGDRLTGRIYNEVVACWSEGIVDSLDWIDAGCVFGFGFPPFRGGPVRNIQSEGAESIRLRLLTLASDCGERFTPHPAWEKLAKVTTKD